ncbi:GNAT family N-acetyltransferase [Veronia pacifica]|uniref:Ribosomal-protein-L7/L12-serine acetyltransferase n=1 Tax=Veronia pacifica TaxID=1080227 RepID=A0A1C3EG73_9GAMM|nr:GNAT family N-acetyltransferase [Veronia pacifica]ODA32266.1 ribosomal-protein-L7/L12-serine acetyltransferase [Veronia pacifica]
MFTIDIDNEISLALVQPSFAAKLYKIVSSQQEYLNQWLPWPKYCQKEQDFDGFIKSSLAAFAENKGMTTAIIYQGELVGIVSYNDISLALKKGVIGYWLSEPFQGKGIISRAVSMIIHMGFEHYQLEKVEIRAATENIASRSVAERLHFELEGVITNAENLHGRIIDHAVYGLSFDTWQSKNSD